MLEQFARANFFSISIDDEVTTMLDFTTKGNRIKIFYVAVFQKFKIH